MKKTITALLFVLALFAVPSALRAQNGFPMIASQDLLRSYALSEVRQAYGSVWSSSMVASPESGFHFSLAEQGLGIGSFHKEVARRALNSRVANPRDNVGISVTYADRDGNALFLGFAFARFRERTPGQWDFPTNVPVELSLNYTVPLPAVSNIFYARIMLLDEEGRTAYNEVLTVDEGTGRIRFPAHFAGASGFLIVNVTGPDGTPVELIFDLRTGLRQTPAAGRVALAVTIRDVVEAKVNPIENQVLVEAQSFNGYGQSPTVELRVQGSEAQPPGTPVTVRFLARTSEGERANAIGFRIIGAPGPVTWHWFPLSQAGELSLPINPGLYHCVFAWPTFGPPPTPIPTPGDGKG